MKQLVVLVLLVLLSPLHSELTFSELQEKLTSVMTSPLVSLMFIYDSASPQGPMLEQGIKALGGKREGYYSIVGIDCNTDDQQVIQSFPYCGPDVRSKLPALTFSEPPLNPVNPQTEQANEPKQIPYQGPVSDKALYDFAVPLMRLYSVNLKKPSDWDKFKETYEEVPTITYFTDKNKIPPFYKALTAHFRHTIAFAHVFSNSSLCEQLGVDEFPQLLLNGKEKIPLNSNLQEQIETLAQYEGEQTKIHIQEYQDITYQLEEDDLQEKVYQNERHILIHLPAKDGRAHPEWKKAQTSFKKMFDYFESESLATKLGVKQLPAIVYFPKSLVKKDVKKTVFYAADNFRAIYNEISDLIDDFTVPLANDIELQKLTALSLDEMKQVVILFHKDEISLSYRVLSNDPRFKEDLVFFRMKEPDADTLQRFQIQKLPSLYVMVKAEEEEGQSKKEVKEDAKKRDMNLRIAHFTGKFNYDDLENYFSMFIQPATPEAAEEETREVRQIKKQKHFDKWCLSEGCYLLLLDQAPGKQEINQAYLDVIKKSLFGINSNVGYLDGKCHSEIISSLDIYAEDLPVLVYVNPKLQKYSRLVGRLEDSSIKTLVGKVRANRGIWRAYESLSFENKDCAEEHQKFKEMYESGQAALSPEEQEILDEIRRKEEEAKKEAGIEKESKRKRRRKRRPKEEDSEL